MGKHITLVAILKITFGILGLLTALLVSIAFIWSGVLLGIEDCDIFRCTPDEVKAVLLVVLPAILLFFTAFSAFKIIGGIGLLQHKPWARILVLILACIDLIDIPIGTAIGIYSLWVLIQDETVKLFQPDTDTEED